MEIKAMATFAVLLLGALLIVLGLAMSGNRAGLFYFVIGPRSLAILALIVAAGAWWLSAARADEGHIPCGIFSDGVASKKIVPADHVTYCFGPPMKRDEAIKRANELLRSEKDQ
jgi:hypothetical protein